MNHYLKYTIILAGYQTEPYLLTALESIQNQTFSDFEAICYVEESQDSSLAICQKFAEHDSRFKVVSAPKSGAVSSTRNYGIDHANGEYLVVIDGDDWLSIEMLEKLSKKLQATGPVDVLSFKAVTTINDNVDWENDTVFSNFRETDEAEVFSGIDAIRRVGRNGGRIHNFTWLSIYRVDFLREHKIYQSPGVLMEDMESTPRIWFFAKTFAYLDETLYVYRRRPNSITTEVSSRLVFDLVRQVKSLMDFVTAHEIPADILMIWSNQWLTVLYWFMFHPVSSRKVSDEDRKKALNILFAEVGKREFCRVASRTTLPKRIATPLVLLAAKGFQFPAKLFFRNLYYPWVERRG